MAKKTLRRKQRLGKMLKRARRMPLLAQLRTHRRMQFNIFSRNWRKQKLRIAEE